MKNKTVFLLIFLLFATPLQCQENNSHLIERKATLALCAGAAFTCGHLFKDTPFLGTSTRDFSAALGIYLTWKALTSSPNRSTHGPVGQALVEATLETIYLVPDAALPLGLGYLSNCHPPFIGTTQTWQRVAGWCKPKMQEPSSWLSVATRVVGARGYHWYKDPVYFEKQTERVVSAALDQLQLDTFLTTLNSTPESTLTVQLNDYRFAKNYVSHCQKLGLIDPTMPDDVTIKTYKPTKGKAASKLPPFTLTVEIARKSGFFQKWQEQMIARKKTALNTILATDFLTNRIVGKAIGSCPAFFFPILQDMPLTCYAAGFAASQIISSCQETIRSSYFPRGPDPVPSLVPLLPTSRPMAAVD
jgi:hypothetical protein